MFSLLDQFSRRSAPGLWPARTAGWLLALLAVCASPVRAEPQESANRPQIAEDDPQLAPPPAAPRTIASWQEALRLVREQAPRYRSELENVARARAQSQLAVAAVLPTLSGQGAYTRQFITEPTLLGGGPRDTPAPNVLGVSGTFDWQVANARSFHGIGTASLNVDASERSFAEQRRQIASAVLEAIIATLVTERVAETNRVGLRAALEREQLARTRQRYGQGTALDIDRASRDVLSARADVVQGDETLRRSREALGLSLGSTRPIAAANDLDLDRLEHAVVDTCRLDPAVEQRPDVEAARLRLELAARAISDVSLQFVPSLALASHVYYNSEVTYGPRTTWDLQAILSVPFFDASRYALLADARAGERQARAELSAVRLQAVVDVAQAGRAIDVARQALTIADEAQAVAERVEQSTRTRFADGLATSLELVDSAQDLRRAQLSAIQARFELARARSARVLSLSECQY